MSLELPLRADARMRTSSRCAVACSSAAAAPTCTLRNGDRRAAARCGFTAFLLRAAAEMPGWWWWTGGDSILDTFHFELPAYSGAADGAPYALAVPRHCYRRLLSKAIRGACLEAPSNQRGASLVSPGRRRTSSSTAGGVKSIKWSSRSRRASAASAKASVQSRLPTAEATQTCNSAGCSARPPAPQQMRRSAPCRRR